MKLPEGWPTEEMIAEVEGLEYDFTPGGSETVTGYVSEEMAREIFEKMYAAAPTPPAQEDGPVCSTCNDTRIVKGTVVRAGQPPKEEYMDCIQCRPTIKEDQSVASPVAWLSEIGTLFDREHAKEYDMTKFTPLYTHPADDKLRKVAEEFVDYFNPGADVDRSPEQIAAFLQAYERNLRAALEGTPTPSNTDKQSPE